MENLSPLQKAALVVIHLGHGDDRARNRKLYDLLGPGIILRNRTHDRVAYRLTERGAMMVTEAIKHDEEVLAMAQDLLHGDGKPSIRLTKSSASR